MKSILVTIFLILCAGSNLGLLAQMNCDLGAAKPFTPEKVKGGYKLCKVYTSINVDDESKLHLTNADAVYTYDEFGRRIGEVRYSDTVVFQSYYFKYDSLGQMIVWNIDYMDGQQWKVTFQYSPKTNLLQEERYVQTRKYLKAEVNEIRKVIKYTYDNKAHLLQEKVYYRDTTSIEIQKRYFYNKAGKLIKVTIGNGGKPYIEKIYKYDSKGYLKELVNKGNISERYSYDEKGNRIEMIKYFDDGEVLDRITYMYDDKGNKLEENEYSKEGELRLAEKYNYNDQGQVTAIVVPDQFNICRSKIMNNYDRFGNLIEEVKYNHLQQPEQKNIYVYSK